MTTRPVPQRHWRTHGNDPLPTPAEALAEPFAAFPRWFLRITCDRCGQQRMFSETRSAQRDMLINSTWRRENSDASGGQPAASSPASCVAAAGRAAWLLGPAPGRLAGRVGVVVWIIRLLINAGRERGLGRVRANKRALLGSATIRQVGRYRISSGVPAAPGAAARAGAASRQWSGHRRGPAWCQSHRGTAGAARPQPRTHRAARRRRGLRRLHGFKLT